jgi:sugar O-acyltransferase (sialic acid O-acetyltransferase NeuD family)
MEKVIILGAGGLAREVLWVIREANEHRFAWDVLGFVDDNQEYHGKTLCNLPVLGGLEWFSTNNPKDVKVICGIGNNESRKRVVEKAKKLGCEFCSIIDPYVRMSAYVKYGEGVVITSGNIITTEVQIGNYVFINLNNTIGHDSVIHDFVNLAPGSNISGNVTLEEGVYIGTGCAIIQGISIGEWSVIGAGATVINDIPSYSVAVGTPARVVKIKEH